MNKMDFKIGSRQLIVILVVVLNAIDLSEQQRCHPQQFTCDDGSCIERNQVCNRQSDCLNGEDERNCPPDCDMTCPDGSCGKRCDKFVDCEGGEDEEGCGECSPYQFQCSSGDCIAEELRCNGHADCPNDQSDEQSCACSQDQFDCGNECIDKQFVCDGYPDCATTGRDEQNCTETECDPATQFYCGEKCIPLDLLCNKIPDCRDGRDEAAESCKTRTCSPSEFTCQDGSCIPNHYICDGTPQCQDRSDEADCGCRPDEFLCENGECIPLHQQCNGVPECRDRSDEIGCPTPAPTQRPEHLVCQPGYELCRSGNECYPRARACDGYTDCRDRSDEENCYSPPTTPPPGQYPVLNLKTYPSSQDIKESTFRTGREVVFQCRDEGPLRAGVRWLRGNNQPLPPGSRDNFGRLEIPNIQIEHAGTYICTARGFPSTTPGAQVSVYLHVEPLVEQSTRPPQACALNEATCSNGDCIPKHLVCNGKFDCADGSDETRCSIHGCEPNEFRCANKRCVLKTWVCDSDDDCGDGSDEVSCGTTPPGSQCTNKQFRCHSGNQCIPRSFHCDSENDCVDKSDEIGCSPVTIRRPPPPMIELAASSIFEITCTAVGVPTPEIVWRLNWGHIPEKCKTTSINGTGVLTCPDIQEEDSGAYSCEAINIRGSVFAVPDTILVVKREPVVCPRGSFNDEAKSPSDCIPCFCFGVTDRCRSADLYTYQLQPPFDAHRIIGVNVNPTTGTVDIRDTTSFTERTALRVTPTRSRFGVEAYLSQTEQGSTFVPYFVMPENYNSNQLKSYGGYLKYNIQYRGYGRPLSLAPDVIITGNGYTLLHIGKPLQPGQTEQITVRFFVGDWVKRTENGENVPATREEIMMALAAVDNILIKLQYVEGSIDTTLDAVEMDSAAARNTGLGLAVYVEECSCPVGYTGYSCESCAPGYVRHRSGPWLGQCYKEERCPQGTYGDPSRGIPCRECPCPHTSPPNQFTQTCSLGPDGNVICNCPVGYKGNRCEECDSGYTGNPIISGDYCKPVQDTCDARGSTSAGRDYYGQCTCKELTTGRNCDICKANTFHLSSDNLFGCIACFCMGVTSSCRSSDYYRDTITSAFGSSTNDFKIVDSENIDFPTDQSITVDPRSREIVYNNFSSRSPDVKYWYLPSRFLGDKITAYGGHLKYTLRYMPTPGGSSSRNTAPDVELISKNHIRLSHFRHPQIEPNTPQTISVPLLEQYWQRNDGQQADREHLLMALADVKAILIKATYTTNSQEVALNSVSLDVAENRFTGNPARALEVEQCDCPPGYIGLSCQDCDYGFKRATHGLYLGLCEKCDCNGFSEECDPETGYCFSCRDHRTGSYCEQCAQGYTKNEFNQCVPDDGNIVNCICDPRGSLAPTCYGGYCRCKANVVGQTCNRCREGTFGLSENLTEGCQSCFCSGVSTECTESNLYIEQIPSEIYGDNHNFTLTDQTMRNKITRGFQTNSARNEIGYFFRPSQSERLFWSLPRKFTGNRITSYGGKLEFTQRYTQRPNAMYTLDQDVIISGNGITIYWTNDKHQQPEIVNRISVLLSPVSNWQRQDARQGPRPASREDIMRVLANVDSILIRAQLSSDTESSFISDITLDTGVPQHTAVKATNVEFCRCPPGYRGTSCEICDSGYYRDLNDIQVGPLGSCISCPCNNHESSCELINTRVICHCLPGYSGYDCSYLEPNNTIPAPEPQPELGPQPTIFVKITEPSLQIVEAGDTVHLHCQARTSTSNAVKIFWTKDSGPLPDRAVDDHQGLLIITDVRISDSGRYICEASDGINVVSQHITLTVGGNPPQRPHATIYPTQVDILEGESFDLRCDATGNPSPDIHWEREDNSQFNAAHGIASGRLHISRALVSDTGRYICRATNIAGTSLAYVDVRVTQANQPSQPFIRPEHISSEIGSSFTLSCETNEDYQTIRWEKEGGYMPYNHIVDNGILTITNARPEDSGIYLCIVTTRIGQTTSKSASVTIKSSEERLRPEVRVSPRNQTVGEGSTVELLCEVSGSPQPVVKWTRAHDSFGPNTQQIANTLRITQVNMADRGIYVCIATNDNGIAQGPSVLEVERRETPQIEIYPVGTQTINEGSDLQIMCRITSGIPTPTLTWSRADGRPINQLYQRSDLLRFSRISIADAGEYICTATNEEGAARASTTIVVNIPPQITLSHTGTVNIRESEYIRLECRASGQPTPSVQWSKHAPGTYALARGSTVDLATGIAVLEIRRASASDQGTYICQANNAGGAREEAVQLVIDSVPSRGDITGEDSGSDKDNYPVSPDTRDNEHPPNVLHESYTAPAGTTAELRCRVAEQNERFPIRMEWTRQNTSLPRSSQKYGSTLYIYNVQPEDGGDYVCLGRDSSTGVVRFTVTVNLVVQSPPRIVLDPPRQVVRPFDNAYILCKATGDQPIDIQWHAVERNMPSTVHANRGLLEFRGIQVSDAGRYRCTAINPAGEADAVAEVIVDAENVNRTPLIPKITITATPATRDLKYGDNLALTCRSNEPGVILTWAKVNDVLADNVETHTGYLRFNSLRTENNGIYRCETKGPSGIYYHDDYEVDIIDTVQEPTAPPPADVQYAPQGESIYMECKTDLEEPVTYHWTKQNGELSADVNPNVKQLRINDLISDNAGTYICSASNGRQTVNTPTVLVVTGIVPYFAQAPNSYLALPTIPDHYVRLNFEVSFKPERDYGLILFNGNSKQKDFLSLAITGGYIEFKFNLGHDTTITLVSEEPVQIGKWHTVKVRRDRKTGIMYVDGKGPVTETGKGKYSGLTLSDPLYLGGAPDYRNIPEDIDIKSGFVGCISQLKIGHTYIDLLKDASVKLGITTCETCLQNPCQHQGVCQESLSKEGYTCICSEGYSGATCNKVASQSCTPYVCGVGRCIDNEYSFECHCPIGHTGSRCEREINVYEPAFTKNAYVAYPPFKTTRRIRVNMKVKPNDLTDGILMYSAQDSDGHGNFVSLAIKDRHVELRYDVGSGPVVIRSEKEIKPGEYITISATKSLADFRLLVSGGNTITERLSGAAQLSLNTPVFLGGVNKAEIAINPGVGVTSGFNGCVAEFNVAGADLHIIESATGSSNVMDCASLNDDQNEISNNVLHAHDNSRTGCSSNPCWNDGQCYPLSPSDYKCSCVNGYTGHDCEYPPNQCDQLRPCQNGGTCEGSTTGYRCICPVHYQGTNCEQRQQIGSEAHFDGDGYLELDRSLLQHDDPKEEVIAIQFSTNSSNGLVFWQGQTPNEDGRDKDYVGLAVENGHLLFTFNAGGGPVDILNDIIRVDDGRVHTAVLKRTGNYGSVDIDNEHERKGEGIYRRRINCEGNIYLGGTPNISLMTGRFSQGFSGCIHGFEIQNYPTIELGTKAISGINVKPCSSDEYDEEIVN